MAKSRFFDIAPPLSFDQLVKLIDGEAVSNGGGMRSIEKLSSVQGEGLESSCVFADTQTNFSKLDGTSFAVCLLDEKLLSEISEDSLIKRNIVKVRDTRVAAAVIANALYKEKLTSVDASPIHLEAKIDASAKIHPSSVIAQGAIIGKGVYVGPLCHVGPGVSIGDNSRLRSSVTISHADIGARVDIFPGARIGQAGFGVIGDRNQLINMPQIGAVQIGDDVLIGANTTIDRGTIDDTIIGSGTRIDNLVQIAHNVILGKNCIVAALTGFAGSSVIEDDVLFGGSAGVREHVTIGKGARIAARAAVMNNVPAGEIWAGAPAKPMTQYAYELVTLKKIANEKRERHKKNGRS